MGDEVLAMELTGGTLRARGVRILRAQILDAYIGGGAGSQPRTRSYST
jgi:hypothetical protein